MRRSTHVRGLVVLATLGAQLGCSDPEAFSGGQLEPANGGASSAGAAGLAGPPPIFRGTGGVPSGEAPGEPSGFYPSEGDITAAMWDDNQHFDDFRRYLSTVESKHTSGAALPSSDRIVVQVTNGTTSAPLAFVPISVGDEQQEYFSGRTDASGTALFYPKHDGVPEQTVELRVRVGDGETAYETRRLLSEARWSITAPQIAAVEPAGLDVAFVLDTTANMDAVNSYIGNSLGMIALALQKPADVWNARYAAVFYRDVEDEYVTRAHDFSDKLDQLANAIRMEPSRGGGDAPEASAAALEHVLALSWRTEETVSRLAFVVLDTAPRPEEAQLLLDQAAEARRAGIKLFPIVTRPAAASNYFGRVIAEWTSAKFIFTTNEVGHTYEPTLDMNAPVPCYEVELLESLLLRLIRSEVDGELQPPHPGDVVRTVRCDYQ